MLFPQDGEERAVGIEAYDDPFDPPSRNEDEQPLPADHPFNPSTHGPSFERCLTVNVWQSVTVLLCAPSDSPAAVFATSEGGIGCLQTLKEPGLQALQSLEDAFLGPEKDLIPRATAHSHTNWCPYTLSDPYHVENQDDSSAYWVRWAPELVQQAVPVDAGRLLAVLKLLETSGVFNPMATPGGRQCTGAVPERFLCLEEQQRRHEVSSVGEVQGVGRAPNSLCSRLASRYANLSDADKYMLALIQQFGAPYMVQALRMRLE
jgi:hypothetical protein